MNFLQIFLVLCYVFNVIYCSTQWPTKKEAAEHCIQPPGVPIYKNRYMYYCGTKPSDKPHMVYSWNIALDRCLEESTAMPGYWKCKPTNFYHPNSVLDY